MENTFISVEWLKKNFNQRNVFILEATFFLPNMERNARIEYSKSHIPNSQFFDIEEISDKSSDLPHMLPSPHLFENFAKNFGICDDSLIVLYDRSPLLSSARAWWMFRYFGHKNVSVLDGGFLKWIKEGGSVESGKSKKFKMGNFKSKEPFNTGVITKNGIKKILTNNNSNYQIIDARPKGRFLGKENEPRSNLRSGHIPFSLNFPISQILNSKDNTIKTKFDLLTLFKKANINLDKDIITTCGSGITACGLTLALAYLKKNNVRVYDGSWAEWGASKEPINKK